MDLNWPPEKTFKYACLKREEIERDCMTIKVEDNTINKDNNQKEEMER